MEDIPEDQDARKKYKDLIYRIMEYPNTSDRINLTPEAAEAFKAFRLEIESQLRPDGDLEPVKDIASRIAGNTARVLGILHIAKYKDNASLEYITEDEAMKAIQIGLYFLEHMKCILYGIEERPEVKDAKYILSKLYDIDNHDNYDNKISKRDLQRLCQRFKKTEDMDEGLKALVEHGYIRTEKKTGTRGRWIYINPEWHD